MKKTTALPKAIAYLMHLLDDPQCRAQGRLPTIERCAVLAGVAKKTMSRAVLDLVAKRLIRPVTGRGLLIVDNNAEPDAQPSSVALFGEAELSKGEKLKRRLLDDIVSGRFAPGKTLPTYKDLRVQYGAGSSTLKKALAALTHEINLVPYKRTFMVPSRKQESQAMIILLFPRYGRISRGTLLPMPRLETMAHYLEKRIIESNLSFCAQQYAGPVPGRKGYCHLTVKEMKLDTFAQKNAVLGYVLWPAFWYERMPELADWLKRQKKPVAIIDDVGDFSVELLAGSGPEIKLFRQAGSTVAPRQVAQYLLRLGHVKAAFITLCPSEIWSKTRYSVLQSTFRELSTDHDVVCLPKDSGTASTEEVPIELERLYKRYIGIPKIQFALEGYGQFLPGKFSAMARRLYDGLMPASEDLSISVLNGAIDKAVADRDITALVCANDDIALYAQRYLIRLGVRVPEEMSVIGFDDTVESFANGLSTYNFNVEALTNTVLDHIVRTPSMKPGAKGPVIIEPEGMVIERGTTGRPRGRR